MTHVANAGPFRNVAEPSAAQILEQHIPTADGGYKQIGVAIVVDIRKGSADTDFALQSDSRFGGDVFKLAVAEIAPQFVLTKLVDEINIGPAISINIRDGQTGA